MLVEGTQRRTTLQTADTHSTFPGTRESDFETTARGAGGGGMPVTLRISKTKSVSAKWCPFQGEILVIKRVRYYYHLSKLGLGGVLLVLQDGAREPHMLQNLTQGRAFLISR